MEEQGIVYDDTIIDESDLKKGEYFFKDHSVSSSRSHGARQQF